MSAASTIQAPSTPKLIALAVPFLGVMGAIQGSAPNINSTALVSLTRDLNMGGGEVALAASLQTIAIAASVITTGLLADRLGRRKVLLAALIVGAAGSGRSSLASASELSMARRSATSTPWQSPENSLLLWVSSGRPSV